MIFDLFRLENVFLKRFYLSMSIAALTFEEGNFAYFLVMIVLQEILVVF